MHLSFDRGDWGRTSGEIYLDRVLSPKWLPCRLLMLPRDLFDAGIIHRSRLEQAMSIMRAG